VIAQKIHWFPRWFSLFCWMKVSTCSLFIELICSLICSCFSFGKLSNCFRRCSLICCDCSSVIGMGDIRVAEL